MAKRKNEEEVADGKYVVYCKLPCGYSFPLPGGRTLALNGSNQKSADGIVISIVGYGRTEVAIEDWEYVMEIYGNALPKLFGEDNPIIFAAENRKDGDEIARDVGPSVVNGMEQRAPKDIIKQAERQANNPQSEE